MMKVVSHARGECMSGRVLYSMNGKDMILQQKIIATVSYYILLYIEVLY